MGLFINKTNNEIKKNISNVVFLLDSLLHDKGNIKLRMELALSLEALDNNSDALFHFFIAYELDQNNQELINAIARNLFKINDTYEAKKWILKLDNDQIKKNKYLNNLGDNDGEFQRILHIGRLNYLYPFFLNFDDENSSVSLTTNELHKLEHIKIIYVCKDYLTLFNNFYLNFSSEMKNLLYISSENKDIKITLQDNFYKEDNNFILQRFLPMLNFENSILFIKKND